MELSGNSPNNLVAAASGMKAQEAAVQMSVAVMKQAMDAEQKQAQALIEMMKQSPLSPDGKGSIIDRLA